MSPDQIRSFFSKKNNVILVAVVLFCTGLLTWSLVSLFESASYQTASTFEEEWNEEEIITEPEAEEETEKVSVAPLQKSAENKE